jgi:hypothetical protein
VRAGERRNVERWREEPPRSREINLSAISRMPKYEPLLMILKLVARDGEGGRTNAPLTLNPEP